MPAPKSTTLLDRTFDEGVALTQEVRNYIAYHEQADRREFELSRCLQVGYQHTRVSARLIQVMTWLLAMKALLSGEISPEQFTAPQYALTDSEELRLLPGWRSPDALAELSFGAVRRVLLDLVDGKPPRDLPPGDTDDLARKGFGVLLGLRIDWAIPAWEQIAAVGGLPEEPDDDAETPEEARQAAAFDTWRGRVFQESQGGVPLAVVAFSQVANEIADFLAEAGEQTGGLEEIRAFVDACRQKAGGDDVVCHPQVIGDALELSFYTEAGEMLDSLTLPASKLPTRAEDMPPLIGAFVRLVKDIPSR